MGVGGGIDVKSLAFYLVLGIAPPQFVLCAIIVLMFSPAYFMPYAFAFAFALCCFMLLYALCLLLYVFCLVSCVLCFMLYAFFSFGSFLCDLVLFVGVILP